MAAFMIFWRSRGTGSGYNTSSLVFHFHFTCYGPFLLLMGLPFFIRCICRDGKKRGLLRCEIVEGVG